MTTSRDTILVVDDNPAGLYFKAHVLRGAGYTVAEAPAAHAAIEHCRTAVPAMALLDVRLPDMHGVELCRRLKAEYPGLVVLQTSAALTSGRDRAFALEGGADAFMIEPIEPEELRAVTHSLLRMRHAEHELRRMNETLEQTVAIRTRALLEANQRLEIEMTERRNAEEALWHAQKLDAIGQLTGGIAHDFNNLLAVIVGGLDLVRANLASASDPPNAKVMRLLTAAQTAADRGTSLTNQLLAFARRSPLRTEVTTLQDIFTASDPLFRRAIGETVALCVMLPSDLWPCRLDPAQFEAAVLNLLVNARDAMPQGGRIEITGQNVTCMPPGGDSSAGAVPGPCVCLRVSDTGTGMPPEIMARVFEPFFTTKEVGKGTGLGLSQVYGFVRQSGGHVAVESAPGAGTTFRLYLPQATDAPEEKRPDITLGAPALSGSETVLVVEDNDDVRAMTVALLHEFGYRVLTAANAPDALAVLRVQRVDLLFTDVVMPGGMDGYQLVRHALQMNGTLRVLLTSGYTQHHAAEGDASVPLLAKPYKPTQLAATLREVLDHP